MRVLAASIVCALVATSAAGGFTPPPLTGHVVDTANLVSATDQQTIDARLERFRLQTGFAIVVFVAGSLAGESIDSSDSY